MPQKHKNVRKCVLTIKDLYLFSLFYIIIDHPLKQFLNLILVKTMKTFLALNFFFTTTTAQEIDFPFHLTTGW